MVSTTLSENRMKQPIQTALSEGRSKEILLIGTINHWKHREVSHVFYAWLKYTARKKFLRQSHASLVERKNEYLLHTMFLKWNRELYGKRASTDTLVSTVHIFIGQSVYIRRREYFAI